MSAPPCAGCKRLQRECAPNCVFAPYFPPADEERFISVDAVFGARNLAKLLAAYERQQRAAAMEALVHLARSCQNDVCFGRCSFHRLLWNMVERDMGDVAAARLDLEEYVGVAVTTIMQLVEDATLEILLRLPPTDPASLIRAAAVCKPWRHIIMDDLAFLRSYRAFHQTPLLLGFVQNNETPTCPLPNSSPPQHSPRALRYWAAGC